MRRLQGFIIVLSVMLAIGVAGCVQPAADTIAPEEIGSQATWTITPSETSTPTITPTPTATPESAEPTIDPLVTPTDAQSAFLAQNELQATEVADAALQDDSVPLENQQPPNQASDLELTATVVIINATLTQEALLTATAQAMGIGQPTPTPSITLVPTVDPFATPDGTTGTGATVNIQPGQDCIHEVRAEDRSLYRLSLAYGVPVMDIARASGIVNPDLIREGQRLTIPGCGITGGRPPATSTPSAVENLALGTGGVAIVNEPTGDCSWGTSVQFPTGCPTAGTTATTGTDTAALGTGGPTTGTTTASRVHVVQQGETLFEISLTYGVSVAEIAQLNGIVNTDIITFNDELLIP